MPVADAHAVVVGSRLTSAVGAQAIIARDVNRDRVPDCVASMLVAEPSVQLNAPFRAVISLSKPTPLNACCCLRFAARDRPGPRAKQLTAPVIDLGHARGWTGYAGRAARPIPQAATTSAAGGAMPARPPEYAVAYAA